jgi:hypothetical protein
MNETHAIPIVFIVVIDVSFGHRGNNGRLGRSAGVDGARRVDGFIVVPSPSLLLRRYV